MNAWIRSRRFTDIVDIHTPIPEAYGASYYDAGKLAFILLPILLSRIDIEALGEKAHEFTAFLRRHPPFYSIKNDPLESEKVKASQAIEKFLKVWF